MGQNVTCVKVRAARLPVQTEQIGPCAPTTSFRTQQIFLHRSTDRFTFVLNSRYLLSQDHPFNMSHTWTSERVALALTAATTAVLGARFLRSLSTTSGSSFPALKGIKDASSDNGQLFTDRSLTRLLAAFAPDGLNATGRDAKGHRPGSGAMIASPSRPEDYINKVIENDDYYFQWPRDSGICVRQVVRAWKKALRGESVGAMGGVKWLREALASARKGADQTTKTTFRGTDGLVTAADLEKIIQE